MCVISFHATELSYMRIDCSECTHVHISGYSSWNLKYIKIMDGGNKYSSVLMVLLLPMEVKMIHNNDKII